MNLISVGKISESFVREACALYAERIRRYAELHLTVVREERISSSGKKDLILREEGKRIQGKLRPGALSIALDEQGQKLTSEALARSLVTWSNGGSKEISFILGGPYGLDPALKKEADELLSLSPMTLTHGMALMVLMEQIYRAFTILRGEPYHK